MIKCEVCGKEFHAIVPSHLKTHGMTPQDYKTKYGVDTNAALHIRHVSHCSTVKPYVARNARLIR